MTVTNRSLRQKAVSQSSLRSGLELERTRKNDDSENGRGSCGRTGVAGTIEVARGAIQT
jgi:hypothetical protein